MHLFKSPGHYATGTRYGTPGALCHCVDTKRACNEQCLVTYMAMKEHCLMYYKRVTNLMQSIHCIQTVMFSILLHVSFCI